MGVSWASHVRKYPKKVGLYRDDLWNNYFDTTWAVKNYFGLFSVQHRATFTKNTLRGRDKNKAMMQEPFSTNQYFTGMWDYLCSSPVYSMVKSRWLNSKGGVVKDLWYSECMSRGIYFEPGVSNFEIDFLWFVYLKMLLVLKTSWQRRPGVCLVSWTIGTFVFFVWYRDYRCQNRTDTLGFSPWLKLPQRWHHIVRLVHPQRQTSILPRVSSQQRGNSHFQRMHCIYIYIYITQTALMILMAGLISRKSKR